MATEFYPSTPARTTSSGDLWAARNDALKARDFHEQALARSPGNRRVAAKIERLGPTKSRRSSVPRRP